jgi:hypothetical protein
MSTLSNFILEETLMADNLSEDELDSPYLRNTRSSPRLGVASLAKNDIIVMVVVVFDESS